MFLSAIMLWVGIHHNSTPIDPGFHGKCVLGLCHSSAKIFGCGFISGLVLVFGFGVYYCVVEAQG